LFRGPLLKRLKTMDRKGPPVDSMVGEVAIPLEDLAPGSTGKAELRGTEWSVHNAAATPLRKGQRSRVTRVDGLTLWIEPEC
jgi:membrane protein implicated in regulation of membrane protease activity